MSFRNGLFAWCFLAWWIFPIGAFAEGHYRLVRPVVCATGPLTIASGQAHLPILELIPDGTPGNASISAVLAQGMPSLSLNLGEKVKTLRLSLARTNGELPASASMFAEPLYVCLMPGGNRPKQGFFLKEGTALIDKSATFFIEMPPDPTRFEGLFSHENGHLIDAYVNEEAEGGTLFRQFHTVPAITDFWTAFSEGWGEHFETLTVEKSETPQLLADYGVKNRKGSSYFTFLRDPMTLAHSTKRYWWIKNGYFAFSRNQVLQDSLSGPELERNFFRNWMNSDFLSGSLKNPQQMLACEGVCATIFFWMSMDKELRENYRPIAFYQPFLGTGTVREVREIVSPEENILLKMVFAKYMLFRDYAASQKPVYRPVMADFIKKYMTLFPEDSGSAVLHFCMATHLTSCWKEGREAYAQTALAVSLMPIETASASSAFQELGKSVQEKMNAVRKESGGLFSEIGEPLWIENDLFQVAILGSEEKQPLSINLNAAEEFELMTIPGVTVSLAGKFVQERDRNGNFTDLAQIEGLGIFLPAQVMELKRMRKRFESAAGKIGKVVGMR